MNHSNLLMTLLIAATLGSTALALSPGKNTTGSDNGAAQSIAAPATPDLTADQELEVEVLTLKANGFQPGSLTRPARPFLLSIQNQSGSNELVFRLTRAERTQVFEVRIRSGQRRNHQRVDLPAGEYILTEVNHPDWRFELTITG